MDSAGHPPTDNKPQAVRDDGAGRYFHFMLNMADDDLDPFQYRLLGHYRRSCGAYNKPCRETTRETADKCRMSLGQTSQTRQWLADQHWISVEHRKNRLIVTLVDRMPENVARYGRSPDERAGGERSPSELPSGERSPGEQTAAMEESTAEIVHGVNTLFTERSPGESSPHIESTLESTDLKQPTPSPSESVDSTLPVPENGGGDGDGSEIDEWDLIQTDVNKLGLLEPAASQLRALKAVTALAWVLAAQTGKNPPGLLVSYLQSSQAPPVTHLEQARREIDRRKQGPQFYEPCEANHWDPRRPPTQEAAPIDDLAARQQAVEQLAAQTQAILEAPESEDRMPFATFSDPPDPLDRDDPRPAEPVTEQAALAVVPPTPLPPVPVSGVFPAQALWKSAKDGLERSVGCMAYENYFALARGVKLDGGVLTLSASSPFVRGAIKIHCQEIERVVSKIAGYTVMLEIVSEWPGTLVLDGVAV